MYTTVIKFDALTDSVGPTTENHNLFFFAFLDFIFCPIGRIVVGRIGFEFPRTGVDQTELCLNAECFPSFSHLSETAVGEFGNEGIGKARCFSP